ncbi:hypothetical protein M885DRAFT_108391 [Pelagophyceae sp. CCMP2097]|nr:hypothetical protein M885DRAFT_108391 [Pelagophyceae sp. CCMP2097]
MEPRRGARLVAVQPQRFSSGLCIFGTSPISEPSDELLVREVLERQFDGRGAVAGDFFTPRSDASGRGPRPDRAGATAMSASQLTLSIAASTCSLSSICDADDCDSAASPGGFQLPLRRQEIMLRRHIRSTYGPPAAKSASRPSSWFRSLATHPILTTIVGVAHMVGLHRVVTFVAAASRRSFGARQRQREIGRCPSREKCRESYAGVAHLRTNQAPSPTRSSNRATTTRLTNGRPRRRRARTPTRACPRAPAPRRSSVAPGRGRGASGAAASACVGLGTMVSSWRSRRRATPSFTAVCSRRNRRPRRTAPRRRNDEY